MSDRELEAIKERKLKEMQKRASAKEQKKEQIDGYKILNKLFKGRAWEVFNTARGQFPTEMAEVENRLIGLKLEGKLNELDGEQLYTLLKKIGLPVRLNTTIKVISNGKTKTLSEKFKEKTK
jgi:DNA-binding TFAR19-related protein (PDSD5 family)